MCLGNFIESWCASDRSAVQGSPRCRQHDFIKEYRVGTSTVKVFDFKNMVIDVGRDRAVVRGIMYVERETAGRQIERSSRYTRVSLRQPNYAWQAIVGHSSVSEMARSRHSPNQQ